MTTTISEVYQRAVNPSGPSAEHLSSNELSELRTAFQSTSAGFLGIGNDREAFLESLAGKNDSLAAALRNPDMTFGQYTDMRANELSFRQTLFAAESGQHLSRQQFDALRRAWTEAPEGSPERQRLTDSLNKGGSYGDITSPNITYETYERHWRAAHS